MQFQPATKTGHWAIGLEIAFLLLMAGKFSQIGLPLPSFGIFGLGIAGFVVAIISLVRKDRAITVWLALIVGLLSTLWTFGELLWPH